MTFSEFSYIKQIILKGYVSFKHMIIIKVYRQLEADTKNGSLKYVFLKILEKVLAKVLTAEFIVYRTFKLQRGNFTENDFNKYFLKLQPNF